MSAVEVAKRHNDSIGVAADLLEENSFYDEAIKLRLTGFVLRDILGLGPHLSLLTGSSVYGRQTPTDVDFLVVLTEAEMAAYVPYAKSQWLSSSSQLPDQSSRGAVFYSMNDGPSNYIFTADATFTEDWIRGHVSCCEERPATKRGRAALFEKHRRW